MIDFSLDWLRTHLFQPHAVKDSEYVLFGSAVLYLHGIRDANSVADLDVFVSRRVWGALFADSPRTAITVETPCAGDPPFLEYKIDTPIHFFYAWTPRDEWLSIGECFARAETVKGWRCMSLDLLRRWKSNAYSDQPGSERHQKHLRDLELIDQHFETTAGERRHDG